MFRSKTDIEAQRRVLSELLRSDLLALLSDADQPDIADRSKAVRNGIDMVCKVKIVVPIIPDFS